MRGLPVQSIARVLRLVASGARAKSKRVALRKVKYRETNPTQANLDCHKLCCGIALNSFGTSVGSRNKATDRGRFLHAAGGLCEDGPEGSRGTSGSQARQQANAN